MYPNQSPRILICVLVLLAFCSGTTFAQVPPGWTSMDINATGGSGNESDGIWAVIGEGSDIWGTSDQFHYVYTTLDGDGSIEARVLAPGFDGGSNVWAKAGVMIRENTIGGSKHVFMANTRNGGDDHFVTLQRRLQTDQASTSSHGGNPTVPYPVWVRLTRTGNHFEGAYSYDENGVTWVDPAWSK